MDCHRRHRVALSSKAAAAVYLKHGITLSVLRNDVSLGEPLLLQLHQLCNLKFGQRFIVTSSTSADSCVRPISLLAASHKKRRHVQRSASVVVGALSPEILRAGQG